VIGLERAAAGSLKNVERQPQRLAAARLAANKNRVADAVRQQRADDHRSAEQRDVRCERNRLEGQAVLEQDRIAASDLLKLRGQQAEGGDGRQLYAVLHRDELRVAMDGEIASRI